MSRTSRRVTTRLAVALVIAGVLGVAAWAVHNLWSTTHIVAQECTVGGYTLDTDQAAVAASMVGAVTSYSPALPTRAAVLALAAGLQESKLRNLLPGEGDRDSVGVLQQRPSQGWGGGKVSNLENVFAATTEFLHHLVKVPGWQQLPLADAVQAVQISADGSAYAQHETEASALADALLGRSPAAVTCQFPKPTAVAPVATIVARMRAELPINAPSTSTLSITVPGARWQTVGWLVSYAERYGIDSIAYDGHTWTRAHGWKNSSASSTAVVATLARL